MAFPTHTAYLLGADIEVVDGGKLAEPGSATRVPWRMLAGGMI